MKIQRLRREPALIVKLKTLGYTCNIIARFLGRSTSFIHRILAFNGLFRVWPDLRKIPCRIRRLARAAMETNLAKYGQAWIAWLLSSEGKPP